MIVLTISESFMKIAQVNHVALIQSDSEHRENLSRQRIEIALSFDFDTPQA
jgi:hypothetical protein